MRNLSVLLITGLVTLVLSTSSSWAAKLTRFATVEVVDPVSLEFDYGVEMEKVVHLPAHPGVGNSPGTAGHHVSEGVIHLSAPKGQNVHIQIANQTSNPGYEVRTTQGSYQGRPVQFPSAAQAVGRGGADIRFKTQITVRDNARAGHYASSFNIALHYE